MPDLILIIWGSIASVGMTAAALWIAFQPRRENDDDTDDQ